MFFDRIEEYYVMMLNSDSQAILFIGSYFVQIVFILHSFFWRILMYIGRLQKQAIGTTIVHFNYDLDVKYTKH